MNTVIDDLPDGHEICSEQTFGAKNIQWWDWIKPYPSEKQDPQNLHHRKPKGRVKCESGVG